MKKEEAASSMGGLAFRTKGSGGLMFWGVNTGFWTQEPSGRIKKCPSVGPRVLAIEDWEPVLPGSKVLEIFEAGEGFLTPPQWKQAVDLSPVKMAVRLTKNNTYMVCLENGAQYYQVLATHRFCKLDNDFTGYKDWKPILEGDVLTTLDFKGESVTFRDPRYPPSYLVGYEEEIKQWSETDTSPKVEEWRRKLKEEAAEHNAAIGKRKPKVFNPSSADTPLSKVRDLAPPEIIACVGPMTTALASSIKSMVDLGDKETAVELAKSLSRLVNNASWHLREDRTAYAEKRATKE